MIFHAPLGGFQPVQRRESAFLFGCWGGDTVMVMCVLNLRRDPSFSLIFRYTIVNWWTLHPNWETSQGSCLGPLLSFGIQRIFHLLTLQPSGNISPKLGDLEKKNAPDYDSRPIFGPYHKAKHSPHGLHLVLQILAKTTPKFGRSAKRLAKIDPPSPIAQGHPPSRDLGSRTLSVKGFDAKISWMSWMSPFFGVHFPALLSSSHSHAHHAGHSHGRHALTWHQGVIHVPFKKCERYKFAGLCLALTRQVSLSLSLSLHRLQTKSCLSELRVRCIYIYIHMCILYIYISYYIIYLLYIYIYAHAYMCVCVRVYIYIYTYICVCVCDCVCVVGCVCDCVYV